MHICRHMHIHITEFSIVVFAEFILILSASRTLTQWKKTVQKTKWMTVPSADHSSTSQRKTLAQQLSPARDPSERMKINEVSAGKTVYIIIIIKLHISDQTELDDSLDDNPQIKTLGNLVNFSCLYRCVHKHDVISHNPPVCVVWWLAGRIILLFDGEVEKCRLIHKCQITFLTHDFISPENINCSPEVFVWFNLKLACICSRSLDVKLRFLRSRSESSFLRRCRETCCTPSKIISLQL